MNITISLSYVYSTGDIRSTVSLCKTPLKAASDVIPKQKQTLCKSRDLQARGLCRLSFTREMKMLAKEGLGT